MRHPVIQQFRPQVFLQIAHAVATDGQDFRDMDPLGSEMVVKGEERPVLVGVRPDHTHGGAPAG